GAGPALPVAVRAMPTPAAARSSRACRSPRTGDRVGRVLRRDARACRRRWRTRPGSRAPRGRSADTAGASVLLPREHVAGAADGEDALRLLRIVFDRGA